MKKIWNEYGLIAILLIVSVGGYLSLGDQKEDFLSAPLEAIRARFTQLMENEAGRAEFSESYADFEKKVRDHEITPEQIESIAASVLNLEAAGAELSPEDADMVIAMATEPAQEVLPVLKTNPAVSTDAWIETEDSPDYSVATMPAPRNSPVDVSPERYRAMSERMAVAFAFADEMNHIADEQSDDVEFRSHVRFTFENGITVMVDSSAAPVWKSSDLRPLTKNMERKRMVRFQIGLREINVKQAEVLSDKRRLYARTRKMQLEESEEELFLFSLERFNRLQEMGMVVHLDTTMLRLQIEESLRLIMEEFDETDLRKDG